ncbi:MAG: hypothetical protein ACYC63_18745 [Armatimonadota bacterium]
MRFLPSRLWMAAGIVLVSCLSLSVASAREVQLAGIRLGDHAVNLLDVYGTPNGIAAGEGPALATGDAPTGGMAGQSMPGMGMQPMPGALGVPPPGAMDGFPGMPSMAGGPGNFPLSPMAGPGMPGAEGAGGPGGAPGGAAGGAGAGGLQTVPFPIWAMAVWVDLGPGQVEWVYNRGAVVLGFVLDRDGFVSSIAVAAESCNFARTALWRPHRYIKLGDDFKRVIYRYGYPDRSITFTSSGPGSASTGAGSVTVQFSPTVRTYSRDCELHYDEANNVSFTLHDMKVTRIHIWE